MVLVNGKDFTVYRLDTNGSIIDRIAVMLDTLTKFLYFPELGSPSAPKFPSKLSEEKNIVVEDLLLEIKDNANTTTDFSTFAEKIEPKLKQLSELTLDDVLKTWLAYNTQIEEVVRFGRALLNQIGKTLVDEGYYEDVDDFIRFWDDKREQYKIQLERSIRNHRFLNQKHTELYETFDNISDDDALVYTDFDTDQVKLSIVLLLKDITILEMFNLVVLTEEIPFAVCNDYYKILKDSIPVEEWIKDTEETLLLKIYEKVGVLSGKNEDFIDVSLVIDGELGQETVVASTKLTTKRGYLTKEKFIDRLLGAFPGIPNLTFGSIKETNVIGNFYFPQERIDGYVFMDLSMINPMFSSLVKIDESNKATKKLSETSITPWIYFHFEHPSTGKIVGSLTQKIVNRSDITMKELDKDIFPHGSPCIKVHVKGRDRRSIEIFQEMLAKLLVIYGEQYNDIVNDYQEFLPEFGEVVEKKLAPIKDRPEKIAPDIFVNNYSRYCNPDRMPTIVSEKDSKNYEKEGLQVMKFPRDLPETGDTIPSDGIDQQYYVCLNPTNKFPGVQANNLVNKHNFPYVPCCFANNQRTKKNSKYRAYYIGEIEENKDAEEKEEKRQQGLITTDKILYTNQYGTLPDSLEKFFDLVDPVPDYKYIRVGLHRNESSFLNAVMVGLHEQTDILDYESRADREEKLAEIRNELASDELAPLARQCMYDMTTEEIQKQLRDRKAYMEPKRYIQLLEKYFNCNIFLFSQEQTIFLPRYVQSYYKSNNPAPCVFIYEHHGSESDRALYPQCELIVRWNETLKEGGTEYSFPFDKRISRKVRAVTSILRESYTLYKRLEETVFPWDDSIGIVSQKVDTYGKTRQLNVSYKNKDITVLCSPIAPVIAIEDTKAEIHTVEVKYAGKLLKKLEANIVSQTVKQGVLKELNALLGNVIITIPVSDAEPFENIPRSDVGLHYPDSTTSSIDIYNLNKKLARYLTEYIFWLFSRHIRDKKIEVITDKVLAKFAKKNTIIIKDFQYKNIPKIFSTKSGAMKDGKLVVVSEDMLKRLMYVLKLYSMRDLKSLLKYHSRNVITQYYIDITDFDKYNNQVILHGEETVDKWIHENRLSYVLKDEIDVGQRLPYFFKNDLVGDGEVYLAQNTNTLGKAMDIAITWYSRGYNPERNAEDIRVPYSFTLYSYQNKKTIERKNIRGKKTPPRQINIMGYKLGGNAYYTTLMNL